MQSIQAFFPELNSPQKVVITTHQKPDGDAMGSSLGLYHFLTQFGHTVTVISPTNWAAFLKWMPGCNRVVDFEQSKGSSASIYYRKQNFFFASTLMFCIVLRTWNRYS